MMGAISPFTNFGFKKIFGEEASKDILISFLNAVLQRETDIVEIQFWDKEKYVGMYYDRNSIYTLSCTDSEQNKFIVQIQNARQIYFKDRTAFYDSFPIKEQIQHEECNLHVQYIYCIGLLGFKIEKNDEKYLHETRLTAQQNERLYNSLAYIYIELPKFQLKVDEIRTDLDKWLYFLKHVEEFNELPSILDSPIFKRAFERANELNLTSQERNAYEASLKTYRDNINVINTAIEEGRKEAREKAKEEVKKEIAQNLLKMGMQIKIIAQGTGLSEDKIKEIQQKIEMLSI